MKNYLALILMISIAIISCEDEPAYLKEGWNERHYRPNKIELSKSTLAGNPIILNKERLLKIEGKPLQVRDSCVMIPIRPEQGMIIYPCWIYDTAWNKVYQIVNDTAFLSHLNFEETSLDLMTPQIVLSKNTSFKEIKKKFPNSYAHRNYGANIYKSKGFDFVHLIDDLPNDNKLFSSQIELKFKNNKLKHLEYHWQPNYTEEQLNVYRQQMKKYDD